MTRQLITAIYVFVVVTSVIAQPTLPTPVQGDTKFLKLWVQNAARTRNILTMDATGLAIAPDAASGAASTIASSTAADNGYTGTVLNDLYIKAPTTKSIFIGNATTGKLLTITPTGITGTGSFTATGNIALGDANGGTLTFDTNGSSYISANGDDGGMTLGIGENSISFQSYSTYVDVTSVLHLTNASNTFTGSGSGLTSLNASNIASGTLADARLSANAQSAVSLRHTQNTDTGTNSALFTVGSNTDAGLTDVTLRFGGTNSQDLVWSNPDTGDNALYFAGSLNLGGSVSATGHSGDGSQLTALSASNVSSGNLGYSYLPTGTGQWNFGSGATLTVAGTGNSPVVFSGATSSNSYLGIGGTSIKMFATAGPTLNLPGASYISFNSDAIMMHASTTARIGGYNRNTAFSVDGANGSDLVTLYYNATAGSRSVWAGPRMLIAGTAAAITSGANLQVTGNSFLTNSTAADVALTVKGASSQTGDLTQWTNNSNTVLAKVDASGNAKIGGIGLGTVVSSNQYSGTLFYCQKTGTVSVGDWLAFDSTAIASGKPYVKRYSDETDLDFAGVAVEVSGSDVTVMSHGICQANMVEATVGASIFPDNGNGGSTFYNGSTAVGWTGNGPQVLFGTALEAYAYAAGVSASKWVFVSPKYVTTY